MDQPAHAPNPLPAVQPSPVDSGVARTRLHRREIVMEGYRRDDGLYDIEGHLTDVKDYDFGHMTTLTRAGTQIHGMWLRITVDGTLTIVDAQAHMQARPYAGQCEQITPDYRKLVGLRIAPGFTQAVRSRLGGTLGCAHLSEMVGSLATTAFQTMAGERHLAPADVQPPHLDRCHALSVSGEVVRTFYPKWYRPVTPPADAAGS